MRQPKSSELNKLVSLTFDESPEVRAKAAEELGNFEDPAALFALAELSYDKEPGVREAAQKVLEKTKHGEKDAMSFAEIFAPPKLDDKKVEEDVPKDKKEKMLKPITKIFERHWGKEKAEMMKSKMMPSIEKIYLNQTKPKASKEEGGRKAMQEFLTSYLEVVSDINGNGDDIPEAIEPGANEEIQKVSEELVGELGELGSKEHRHEIISREVQEIESDEQVEIQEEKGMERMPDTFVKKAYETMMLSNGDDATMKKEMKRMMSSAEADIKLAFNMAKNKFKETKITNITQIRDRMRNINTEILLVKDANMGEYQKSKKVKATYMRMLVSDEDGNEGLVYLFDDRGTPVRPGMRVKIEKGYARTFDFSGETALTVSKKGLLYIVL